MAARRVRASGRVQGVFFRAWTCKKAQGLGVAGWVRNCSDGSVEAHLEGDENAVGALIEEMREGPPGARVDGLQVRDCAAEEPSSFEVRR